MKNISYLLVFLILMQSCNVYDAPISVDAAVAADRKAKVITTDNQKYKFRRLENKNDRLIGVTKKGSPTAGKLAGAPSEMVGNYLEIDLSSLDIEKIRLRNKAGSVVLTIVAIAGTLFLIVSAAAVAALSSWGM